MMRLPVAIAGTLMVPAMYFLAVQLVSKKTALLTALFTACSAYMLNYSRDAKMYMDTWLFVTLNVACLLWWLRTRSRVSWWAWLCSGVIMVGLHAVALAILPIELIIVITARPGHWRHLATLIYGIVEAPVAFLMDVLATGGWTRLGTPGSSYRWFQRTFAGFRWPPILFFLIGSAIIAIGPYIFYTHFSAKAQRVYNADGEDLDLVAAGIPWVGPYNRGRTWVDLLRYTGTAFLYSWEWPRPVEEPGVRLRTLRLMKGAAIGLGALLALGMLPWQALRRPGNLSTGPPPRMLPVVWIALWIILPAYGFYCISVKPAVWPIDWLASMVVVNAPPPVQPKPVMDGQWHQQLWWQLRDIPVGAWWSSWGPAFTLDNVRWWFVGLVGAALIGWAILLCLDFRRHVRVIGTAIFTLLVVLIICTAFRLYGKPFRDSVWMPRYLGFIWPAFAMAVCALLLRLPTKPLRWSAVALLLVVNLAQHWGRVFAGSEPPVDQLARDIVTSQPPSDSRCYVDFAFSDVEPGTGGLYSACGRYYLSLASQRPILPHELPRRGYERQFEIWTPRLIPPFEIYVANTVQSAPAIKRIIVWDNLHPGQVRTTDEIADRLSPNWKLVTREEFRVRDHWTWRDLITARRRVYERKPTPLTPPQAEAATQLTER
jgi:hypothetical protein